MKTVTIQLTNRYGTYFSEPEQLPPEAIQSLKDWLGQAELTYMTMDLPEGRLIFRGDAIKDCVIFVQEQDAESDDES